MSISVFGQIKCNTEDFCLFEEIAFYLTSIASSNKIGLNLNFNISQNSKNKCDFVKKNIIYFEMSDSPLSDNAEWLFIGKNLELPFCINGEYKKETFSYRMNKIQRFLNEIFYNKYILEVNMDINHLFGEPQLEFRIKPEEFVETMELAYSEEDFEPPIIRIIITPSP